MPGGWGKRLGFSSIAITAAQKEPPAGREPRRAFPEVTDFGLRASCVSELAARDDLAKVELRAERDALEPHAHLGLAEPVKGFGVLRTDDFAVMFAGHEESGAFGQTDDFLVLVVPQELFKTVFARFVVEAGRARSGDEVRVRLERDEPEGVEGRRFGDRHVVRRAQRRAGDVAACG